ncbi:uncharacterized protein LOC116851623 [Odontomachus brunneus]|uniref:uncharacterized protein LOC116851623 n=1 Tax=Odontomachus brunneus TaxID=486640 RepID=UPI0013F1DC9B|nr:uncharacterized protein LOC116851623 [Odontomachus brunneus]
MKSIAGTKRGRKTRWTERGSGAPRNIIQSRVERGKRTHLMLPLKWIMEVRWKCCISELLHIIRQNLITAFIPLGEFDYRRFYHLMLRKEGRFFKSTWRDLRKIK